MVNNVRVCPLERISRIRFFLSPAFHWCIIGFGALLRVAQFLYNRSLTEGEAALALNIIEKSYSQLLHPLDYAQAAPVGFLIAQRFMASLFGTTEMAMRVIPLAAGIVSLILFYYAGKRILKPAALLIGLILFAVGDHLIYFASEVKQYSTDVFWTLCIIILALWLLGNKKRLVPILLFSLVSAVSLWFSHPVLFVVAACALVISIVYIKEHALPMLFAFLAFTILVIASFILNYAFILAPETQNAHLIDFWQPAFMPFPPTNLSDLFWYPYVFLRTFKFPVGMSIYTLGLAVLSFLIGFLLLARTNKRVLALLMIPVFLTLIASAVHRYPFEGRLLLFLTPLIVIIIAKGLDFLREGIAQYHFPASILAVLIVLAYPIGLACYRLVIPRAPEELRPVMEYVNEHYRTGDVLYLYYGSVNAYHYYAPRFTWTQNPVYGTEARENWTGYYEDILRIQESTRAWFLFSHVATTYGVNEQKLFVSYLDLVGSRIDEFRAPGAAGYLYDLSYQD